MAEAHEEVYIYGKKYIPVEDAGSNGKKIGIAISTRNRQNVLSKTLQEHGKFLPDNCYFIVVDDGSDREVTVPSFVNKVIRHQISQGIVEVKNTSLCALIEAGCEELFLWDDDAYPIAKNWHLPYIESPEPHLSYQFLDVKKGVRLNDIKVLHQDSKHVAYSGQRGVMLYYHKSVMEKVGGFDRVYQRGMYEHGDLAIRIHNAGLTSWAYADVVGSDKLIHSMDEYMEVERSVPPADRKVQVERNVKIFNFRRDTRYTGFAEYRNRNVVITNFLTTCIDPQRAGKSMSSDPKQLDAWAKSIIATERVIISDCIKEYAGSTVVKVDPVVDNSPYFLRWLYIYQYLRDNPTIKNVWCTDGTDVIMLNAPWNSMQEGKIYVGCENSTYANPWFKETNPHPTVNEHLDKVKHQQVLNAGLVGGSRENVMLFIQDIIQQFYLIKSHEFWSQGRSKKTETDMGLFAVTCERFKDKLVWGPQVNTIFKSNGLGKEWAWWQHK